MTDPEAAIALDRVKDRTRPQDPWTVLVCGGVERLTNSLMRGDRFTEAGLRDMQALRGRLEGFARALEARERAEGEVLED